MKGKYLITGGAGFIGTNLADYYLSRGHRVAALDNFSRVGSEQNARWLAQQHGDLLEIISADIRYDVEKLCSLANEVDVIFHLAGQVAVTTSVADPRSDFETNALGTFNVLEAARLAVNQPVVLYSSTNKVYGKMTNVHVVERNNRYEYADMPAGIGESYPLDFYSPYGCSKGAGDQYVADYARIYGLRTIVFRQSCIYGRHQFGIEDQGWVAWFAIRAMQQLPVTIYGDGKQIRDVLDVGDLVAAYDAAVSSIDRTAGNIYNIGGGPANTLSLLELVDQLNELFGYQLTYNFDGWRPGDQRVFVSDVRKAEADFGWRPTMDVASGLDKLVTWLKHNAHLFAPQPEVLAA